MTSLTGKQRQATQHGDPVDVELIHQRLSRIEAPAVLTELNGLVTAANDAWDELMEEIAAHRMEGEYSITELLSGHVDTDGQRLLEMISAQLAASNLQMDDLELALDADGRVSSHRVRIAPLLDQHAGVIAAIWTFQDISAERQARELTRHRDKMQAISRLSAGIAHEFNNLLTAVLGNLEIMRAKSAETLGSHLDSAESAAVRATRLIQELRHFGTRSLPGLKPQLVSPVLEKSVQILEGMCPPGVCVTCSLESGVSLSARIDADLLQDVILRIGRNSMEAIPESGGTIRLTADLQRNAESGVSVRIQVVDDGPGLDPTAHDMVFEPFFTTRSPDSNSGLGLAIVYGLIEEMGGTVEIQSGQYHGTTVTMLLPYADLPEVVEPVSSRTATGQTLHVGLVDNEPGVRSVGQGMLKLIGHDVTTFTGGQNLLDSLANGLQLDVILLDRAMPAMSGRETYCHVRQSGCTTPVIICSGTSVELASFCPQDLTPPEGFLGKPFTLAALSEAVEQASQCDVKSSRD